MPANCHARCLDGGGAGSGQPSARVSVTVKQRCCTQRHIVRPFIPCRRAPASGECLHEKNKGVERVERTHNVCCVNHRKQSRRPASERSEKRSVGWSFMPTRRQWPNFCRVCCGSRAGASSRVRTARALLPEAAVCEQSCRHRRAGTSIVAEAIGRSLTRRSFGESRQRECGLF